MTSGLRKSEMAQIPAGRKLRLPAAATLMALVAFGGSPAASALADSGSPREAVELLEDVAARKAPDSKARIAQRLPALTPANADQLRLPIRERQEIGTRTWLRVMLPGRPNNRTAWIPYDSEAMDLVRLTKRIRIDVDRRVMAVFDNGKLRKRIRVVVGARSTPTPLGTFFVMERVQGLSWAPRGWALALSAYSNVLRHFDGGDGQVAIHARGSLVGALGSASSHGCIRVDDPVARWLKSFIPNGTYVEIV